MVVAALAGRLAADLPLAGLIVRASTPVSLDRADFVVALQLLLVTTYAGFMTWRTLARERRLELFEVWQVPLSIAVGLGGALIVTSAKSASDVATRGLRSRFQANCCRNSASMSAPTQPRLTLRFGRSSSNISRA
jgi:hypothetical protein